MASGGWKTITQLSQIGEVQNIGPGCGLKGDIFSGIFVMMSNGNYESSNHSLIRPEHPPTYISKQGLHHTQKDPLQDN